MFARYRPFPSRPHELWASKRQSVVTSIAFGSALTIPRGRQERCKVWSGEAAHVPGVVENRAPAPSMAAAHSSRLSLAWEALMGGFSGTSSFAPSSAIFSFSK
jgi:hypothetical protein